MIVTNINLAVTDTSVNYTMDSSMHGRMHGVEMFITSFNKLEKNIYMGKLDQDHKNDYMLFTLCAMAPIAENKMDIMRDICSV